MTDPEATDPNPNLKRAERVAVALWEWSHAHTAISASVLGFVLGFLCGKW